jgi:uncharacterized protein YndB with AHSA1/START domain
VGDASATRSATVDAPVTAVWAALAAFDQLSTWSPDADHTAYLTEQTDGIGCARRVQVGRMVLIETVTEWDPTSALAYTIEGLPPVVGTTTNRWTLRPDGDRTEVTLTSTVDPGTKPIGRLAAPLVARRLAKASDAMLSGLAAHLEGTP